MFRLLEIQLGRHEVLADLRLNFVNGEEIKKGPYTTLVIGQNGSGKSHLLRAIIEIFRELENISKTGKVQNLIRGGFSVKFQMDKDIFEVNTIAGQGIAKHVSQRIYLKNKSPIQSSDIRLPKKVIANSIMLNDRFPVVKEGVSDIYRYRGIRRTPSVAGTRSHLRKTVFDILGQWDSREMVGRIKEVLGFLGYADTLEISFYPRYKKKFFYGNLTLADFQKSLDEWVQITDTKGVPFWLSEYKRISKDIDLMSNLVKLLNKISSRLKKYDGSRAEFFVYDVITEELTTNELKNLEIIYKLNILSEPSLILKKNKSEFPIGESSSGEYHILVSMIGIMTEISPQSLVLIDEPEISLHPNWQMRYVHFLKEMMRGFQDCHFLIATHSHFLVSDLAKESSALIHLYLTDKIRGELLQWNTFGWSAEQVLFDVFHVPTTRNYFVADRVGAILDLVAKPERDEDEIRAKVRELRESDLRNLPAEDPLKDVVEKLFQKYAP